MKLDTPRNSTAWSLDGASTFRKSSRIILDTWGMNLQNPSKRICRLHLADKGKKLIQADQAGAEALIVAHLAPEGNYLKLFKNGIKPHTFMAMHLFPEDWERECKSANIKEALSTKIEDLKNLPYWKSLSKTITEYNDGKYYYIGKKSIHSFSYRKMPNTFRFDVLKESDGKMVLPLAESNRIRNVWADLFPEIHIGWWNETDNILRETRTLYNLFNFPRYFGGPFTDKFFREAIAFVPQSTVGTITSRAFVYLQLFIEENRKNWDLLNDKHDSILIQVPIEEEFEAAKVLKNSLEQDLVSPRGVKFKMKSEVSSGLNWGKYDEVKNPDGMKEITLVE